MPDSPAQDRNVVVSLFDPFDMLNLKAIRSFVILAAVVSAAVWGWNAWRRSTLLRQFDETLTALHHGGDVRAALQLARSLDRISGLSPHARLLRGAATLRDGDFAAAFQILQGVDPLPALRQPLALLMGECLYRAGDLTEAERAFRFAAIETPVAPGPHRWLAVVYHDVGAMHLSLQELEVVARLLPDDHFAFALMGQLYSDDFERPKEAAECFAKAIERNPPPEQRDPISRELARARIGLNDFQGALNALQPVAEDAPTLALRSECLWNLGRLDEARALLDRAKDISPEARSVKLLEARLLLDRRDGEGAARILRELVEQDPHDVSSRYQLSIAYRLLKDEEHSRAELDRMKESRELRNRLHGLYERAMRSPLDADVRDEIAALCENLGQQHLADIWRRAALAARKAILLRTPMSASSPQILNHTSSVVHSAREP